TLEVALTQETARQLEQNYQPKSYVMQYSIQFHRHYFQPPSLCKLIRTQLVGYKRLRVHEEYLLSPISYCQLSLRKDSAIANVVFGLTTMRFLAYGWHSVVCPYPTVEISSDIYTKV
ncbi:hypothetical protein BGZ94_009086, partial [Podila epigama]